MRCLRPYFDLKKIFYVAKWYWAFSVISGGVVEIEQAPGGVKLHPRRSQEVRRRPELPNGVLRALEDAWMTTFRVRHLPVNSRGFLSFWACLDVYRRCRATF